jgi:hypothetical protein
MKKKKHVVQDVILQNVDQRGNDPSLSYTLLGRMRLSPRMDARIITRFKVHPLPAKLARHEDSNRDRLAAHSLALPLS